MNNQNITHHHKYFNDTAPARNQFENTLKALRDEVLKNISERAAVLALKDLKLLNSVDASIVYLGSLYANEWRMCLPVEVKDYLADMERILGETRAQKDGDKSVEHLSILDVHEMHEYTDNIVHFLLTEFDKTRYVPRVGLITLVKGRFTFGTKRRVTNYATTITPELLPKG